MNGANARKLENLLTDVFLLEPGEFNWNLTREAIVSWDSLGVVSMAVGVHETFGIHFAPEEAIAVSSVQDLVERLTSKGIDFSA